MSQQLLENTFQLYLILARQLVPDINFQFLEDIIDGKRIVALIVPAANGFLQVLK